MATELRSYNLVSTYQDRDGAGRASEALAQAGVPESEISYLGRTDEAVEGAKDSRSESEQLPRETAKRAATGAAAGAALGAIVMPGIGAAVGAGVWAALAGGAAAGATAGGVWGGLDKMWNERFRDTVAEGRVLVGVHTDDPDAAKRARDIMLECGAGRVDEFDRDGNPTS